MGVTDRGPPAGVSGLAVSECPDAADIRLEGRDDDADAAAAVEPVDAADRACAEAAIELAIEARRTADRDGGRVESRSPSRLGGRGAPTRDDGRGGGMIPSTSPPEDRNVALLGIAPLVVLVVGDSVPSPRAKPARFADEGLPNRGIALPRMTLDLRWSNR